MLETFEIESHLMEVDQLIQKAEELLSAELDLEAKLSTTEDYVASFADWHAEFDPSAEVSDELREKLVRLSDLHAKVLAFISELRDDSMKELRKFKAKAKGIMAYTDRLPKRISIAAKRKG